MIGIMKIVVAMKHTKASRIYTMDIGVLRQAQLQKF